MTNGLWKNEIRVLESGKNAYKTQKRNFRELFQRLKALISTSHRPFGLKIWGLQFLNTMNPEKYSLYLKKSRKLEKFKCDPLSGTLYISIFTYNYKINLG